MNSEEIAKKIKQIGIETYDDKKVKNIIIEIPEHLTHFLQRFLFDNWNKIFYEVLASLWDISETLKEVDKIWLYEITEKYLAERKRIKVIKTNGKIIIRRPESRMFAGVREPIKIHTLNDIVFRDDVVEGLLNIIETKTRENEKYYGKLSIEPYVVEQYGLFYLGGTVNLRDKNKRLEVEVPTCQLHAGQHFFFID